MLKYFNVYLKCFPLQQHQTHLSSSCAPSCIFLLSISQLSVPKILTFRTPVCSTVKKIYITEDYNGGSEPFLKA